MRTLLPLLSPVGPRGLPVATAPLAALALAACDYRAPLDTTVDDAHRNVVSGALVYAGDAPPSHTVVLLFDATNPPPPAGTGRPLTFATVPAGAFTAEGADGLRAASFSIPHVADTTAANGLAAGYLITAVMDMDHDFAPLPTLTALGGSTFGDWTGTYVTDLVDLDIAPLFVEGGVHLDNVTVLVGQEVALERPAFTTAGAAVLSKARGAASLNPADVQTFRLRATGVHTVYAPGLALDLEGPCPVEACDATTPVCACDPTTHPSEVAFHVWFVDRVCALDEAGQPLPDGPHPCEEGDGWHDPHPGELQAANGVRDTWPRVYLEWIGLPVKTEAGVIFDDGGLAPFVFEGPDGTNLAPERWVAEAFPLARELAFLGPAGLAPEGAPFAPFPARELSVTWSPVVRRYHAGGTYGVDPANGPFDVLDLRCVRDESGAFPAALPYCAQTGEVRPDDFPSGAWRLTVVSHTGQTWTLPNEIGLPAAAVAAGLEPLTSSSDDFDASTQGLWLTTE